MKKYSPEEIRYLQTWYARKGKQFCAKALGRSERSIKRKAIELSLRLGDTQNYMPLFEASRAAGINHSLLLRRAIKEKQVEYFGRKACAKNEWLDKTILELTTRAVNAKKYRHWLNAKKVAAILGVSNWTFYRSLRGQETYISKFIPDLVSVKGGRNASLFSPESVEIVRVKLEAERKELAEMKTFKTYCVDLNLDRTTALKRLREIDKAKTKKAVKNGIYQRFYVEAS